MLSWTFVTVLQQILEIASDYCNRLHLIITTYCTEIPIGCDNSALTTTLTLTCRRKIPYNLSRNQNLMNF